MTISVTIPVSWPFISLFASLIYSAKRCLTYVMMSSFIFPIMLDTSSFHVDRCCELFKGGYLSQSSIVLVMMDVSV